MTSRNRALLACERWITVTLGAAMLSSGAMASETISYRYDELGRLVQVQRAGTVNNNVNECYSYDPASNRSNVTVSTTTNCNNVSFSINDASATEGSPATFTVTRAGPTSGSYTINYATADGTATAGSDYTATSGTLTFGAGVATQTVQVSTLSDSVVENNETFNVNLSGASGGATISDSQGVGTIIDNTPTCSGVTFNTGNAPSVTEGGTITFTVTKSGTAAGSCSVHYATQDDTATAGSDYTAVSGTLQFAVSDTSKTVSVQTIDDTVAENTEDFFFNISNPTGGATLGMYSGQGAIIDNDTGNRPPIANPYNGTVRACGSTTVDVVTDLGDSDPDGDPFSVTAVTNPTQGSARFSGTTVTYSTFVGSGTDSLTYTITDSHGASASNVMNFTIGGGICAAPVQ